MHTPYPQPLAELAGTRRVLETAHKLIGAAWGDEGTTRAQHAWVADPDLIRRLAPGRPATSATARPPSSRSPGPRPSPLTLLPAAPAPDRARPVPAPGPHPPPTPARPRPPAWMTCSDPEPPRDPPTRSTSWACPPTPT